jgi:hypothetical protein
MSTGNISLVGLLIAEAHAIPLVLIVVVVLVAIVLATHHVLLIAVAHIFHPHIIGFFAAMTVLLFLLLALFGVHHGGMQAIMNTVQPPNANLLVAMNKQKEVKVGDAGDAISAAIAKDKSEHDSKSPPTWINDPPHREGDSYFVVVRLDADTNPAERDEWLDQRMLVAAKDYIDERLYPGDDVSKVVKINANYLYDNCLREVYPSSGLSAAGQEVFARLEFDRKFREEVEHRYRQTMEEDHVRWLAGGALAGLAVLGGLYGYLRTTAPKVAPPPDHRLQTTDH